MWYERPVVADAASAQVDSLTWEAFVDVLSSPVRRRELGGAVGGLIVVRDGPTEASPALVERAVALPVVVVADGAIADLDGRTSATASGVESTSDDPTGAPAWADTVASDGDLDAVLSRFRAGPQAATTLALLLRGGARRSVDEGLVAESMAYSALQGGEEFAGVAGRTSGPAPAVGGDGVGPQGRGHPPWRRGGARVGPPRGAQRPRHPDA